MSVYDKSYESLLNYGGKSANFPKMSNLLESMYHLMTAVQYSSLKKEMLYPYLLNLASFASELLQGDLIYQAAHITAPYHLPEPSLSQALAKNSFLSRAQVIQMSQNVYMREFVPKTEKVAAKLISQAVIKRQLKHVFFPSSIEFQYKQFFDFQLDFTVSFIFLLIHLFLHGCLLESFDCHRDVSFRNFQLKQLVFNASAAGEYVTFWWPAFSFDEQCVFQARYIQSQVVDAEELLGDSSFLEDVRIKSGIAEPKGNSFQATNTPFGYTMPSARPDGSMIMNGTNGGTKPPETLQPAFTQSTAPAVAKSGVFIPSNIHEHERGNNQLTQNRQNLTFNGDASPIMGTNAQNDENQFTITTKQASRLNQTQMQQTQYQTRTKSDQLFTQKEIIPVPGTQGLGTEAVENIVKQMTDRLNDRLELLEKMSETNKQNNIVLNQNLKKLNGDFKKLYDAVEEISKTVIQVVNKGINDQHSLGITSKLNSKSTSLFK